MNVYIMPRLCLRHLSLGLGLDGVTDFYLEFMSHLNRKFSLPYRAEAWAVNVLLFSFLIFVFPHVVSHSVLTHIRLAIV